MEKIISKIKRELNYEIARRKSTELALHNKKRLLANIFFSLNELSKINNLEPYNYLGMEQLKHKTADELIEDANTHFLGIYTKSKAL